MMDDAVLNGVVVGVVSSNPTLSEIFLTSTDIADFGRAKKLAKSSLFKAEPLPFCKMENDCMDDIARC